MIRAEREGQTDDSTREEGEPDTELGDEKIRETVKALLQASGSGRGGFTRRRGCWQDSPIIFSSTE